MATWTVTLQKRNFAGSFELIHSYPTFTSDQDVLSLAFDGRYFWFGTQAPTFRFPNLFKYDHITGQVVRKFSISGFGSRKIMDLVHHGTGFYAVTQSVLFGSAPDLHELILDGDGKVSQRPILLGINTNSRCLAWDGEFIYTSDRHPFSSVTSIRKRERKTGNIVRSFSPVVLSSVGSGLVFAHPSPESGSEEDEEISGSAQLVIRADPDPKKNPKNQYVVCYLATVPFLARSVVTETNTTGIERPPITWDGYYVYEFEVEGP